MARSFDILQSEVGNFGPYQIRLVLITQLPYIFVTGTMLCTVYDGLQPVWSTNLTTAVGSSEEVSVGSVPTPCSPNVTQKSPEYYSLIVDFQLACVHSYIPTLLTTAVMVGGVIGAVVFGHLADRYGRRRCYIGALLGTVMANGCLAAVGTSQGFIWLVLVLLFTAGFFGGAYMVIALVILLENVGCKYRLLCVSFNGWPAGIIAMALVGYVTGHWRWYHLALASLGIPFVIAAFFVDESPRWLLQQKRFEEADNVLRKIAKQNRRIYVGIVSEDKHVMQSLAVPTEDTSASSSVVEDSSSESGAPIRESTHATDPPRYTYLDLIKHRQLFLKLLALFYSWLASSVISFGIYFGMDKVAGNLYLNTFVLGLLKGLTGMIPLVLNMCMGRRPVIICAAMIACASCWGMVVIYFTEGRESGILPIVVILGASAIDPIWKINHLYSAELFPTVVRNMARAACNVGSRVGSVLGPQINYLSALLFPLPYIIYGLFSIVHVFVCWLVLPETKGVPLPDSLSDTARSEHSCRSPSSVRVA